MSLYEEVNEKSMYVYVCVLAELRPPGIPFMPERGCWVIQICLRLTHSSLWLFVFSHVCHKSVNGSN